MIASSWVKIVTKIKLLLATPTMLASEGLPNILIDACVSRPVDLH